jgi:hypothetical protein
MNWKNISKTILEKVFIFIFSSFFLILGFVSKNFKTALLRGEIIFLKIGHIGYKKNQEWYAGFKSVNIP